MALEGLRFSGDAKIFHLLEVLHNEVGVDTIQNVIEEPLSGFKIGTHCGCHAIRPSDFKFTDEPEDPVLLENLTKALGADTPYYPEKMDCCGATLVLTDYEAAFKLTGVKLQSLQKRGYDALVTNCPFCLKMYDSRQEAVGKIIHQEDLSLPVFYITQLIGLTLGLDEETLGLNLHMSPVDEFVEKLRDA